MVAQSVTRPITWLVNPRSCAIVGATLHDWSHDDVQPVCDLLRFAIAGPEFWTWPSILLRPSLLVRSPTTSKINHTICQRFICDYFLFCGRRYVITWSQARCDWGVSCFIVKSHKVKKPRDSDLDFSNGSDFYWSLGSSAAKRSVKFQDDIPNLTPNLVALMSVWLVNKTPGRH